jgi:ankyrin repeat protein
MENFKEYRMTNKKSMTKAAISLMAVIMFSLIMGCGSSPSSSQNDPNSRLANAVMYRNFNDVKSAIADGANVNYIRSGNTMSLLYIACANIQNLPLPNLEIVKLLIDKGADVTSLTNDKGMGFTTKLAALSGRLDIVSLLVEKGININIRDYDDNTALMGAARNGHFDIVRYLVEQGINVNLRNEDGETAASIAYDKGEIDIYNYLVANGAIEFTPRQVSQQPSTASQASSQPSVPSQSASAEQSSQSSSTERLQQTLQDVNKTIQGSLQNGRYRMSGRTEELSFSGIANSGSLFFKDAEGKTSRGTYTIKDDLLTINVLNRSFFYTITSRTSFTGHEETWIHVGF